MARNNGGASSAGAPSKTKAPQWQPHPPDSIKSWLAGKTLQQLGATEQGGRAMYPETIRRRDPKTGELQEVKLLVRVPTSMEIARSRLKALDWVKREARLSSRPTLGEAEAIFGPSAFDEIDTVFFLAACLFDLDPMGNSHPPYMIASELDANHPRASLHDLYARVSFYQSTEDPRVPELTEAEFSQTVAAIAKAGNLSPLVVIDGRAHSSFIATMASQLAAYQTAPPS